MRSLQPARTAIYLAVISLLAGTSPAWAQTASPTDGTGNTQPVPNNAAMDKGVPPAKHAGDEGGKPSAPSSGQNQTPDAAEQRTAPAQ